MPDYPNGIWIDEPSVVDHNLNADLTAASDQPNVAVPAVEYGDFAAAAKNPIKTDTYCNIHNNDNDIACS